MLIQHCMSSPAARGLSICGNTLPDEFFQSKRVITPIGTRASPPFSRDNGRMRRWEGALCLSWGIAIPPGFHDDPLEHLTRTRTSTRPPHPPHPTPCPYRTAYVSCCIRSAKFMRGEGGGVDVGRALMVARVALHYLLRPAK